MAVSEKMRDGIENEFYFGEDAYIEKVKTRQAQAVINAAWHKFDPGDESTWPHNLAHMLVCNINTHQKLILKEFISGKWWPLDGMPYAVTHYADPTHLMPEGIIMAKFIINASTHAFFTIGEIEAPNKEKAEELAYKMMEDGKVDTPCLCHYCAGNIELNDFEINEGDVYEVGT